MSPIPETDRPIKQERRSIQTVIVVFAAIIMAVPPVAGLFISDFDWGPGDFLIWGIMLATLASGILLAKRIARSRLALGLMIGTGVALFVLIWAELAVGIFD